MGALLLLLALAAPAFAEATARPVGVVELFTSQGCSSCPPADALLAELAGRDDVVALSYHVDYWDYLGWKDTLATPENTARQRAYGAALDRPVYTPQAVINGHRDAVGSNRKAILAALDRPESGALSVDIALSARNGSIFVDIGAAAGPAAAGLADAHVIVVYYKPSEVVSIESGENRGRSVDYRNVVTGFQTVGMWHGDSMRLELPKSEIVRKGGRCAVLVQAFDAEGRPGIILGAAHSGFDW